MQKLKLTILILILLTATIQAKVIDKIVAIVGDKIITQYDVESFNPKKVKQIYSIKDEARREILLKKYYKEVLDFLVNQYIYEIAAEREGIKVTDDEVDRALNDVLKQNNITMDQLEQVLEQNGLTLEKYKYQLKNEILNARIRSAVIMPKLVVTDEDIKNYIDEHQNELKLADKYELRIIRVSSEDEVKKVKEYIKEKSFADAAIKFSKDKTSKKGGYVGWLKISDLPEKYRKIVIEHKKGDVFEMKDGKDFVIFYIEDFKSKYDVDDKLREEITRKIKEKMYPEVVKSWLEKHKTTIFIKYM
ncbi:peptidylprolyl isomerase [Deferribacter autotrophicus]|uniref:Peptidylprolyl isomerase n=1 Tax=Deferribacter autotrophicus TaxID=500465 RepID=A0A5A8F4W0_9BACT|nr:SurA N-terminal domain-containing protein [Deferribacter autotrophicus]KAA0258661.1 peptidylprolyl isomerase [Deferribacter autotrophicus]